MDICLTYDMMSSYIWKRHFVEENVAPIIGLSSEMLVALRRRVNLSPPSAAYMRQLKGSRGRRQAIFWTNAGILLIGPLGTNGSEMFI